MQRAFAPEILKLENSRASLTTAGWISPFPLLTAFVRPKCEKMRRPCARRARSSWIAAPSFKSRTTLDDAPGFADPRGAVASPPTRAVFFGAEGPTCLEPPFAGAAAGFSVALAAFSARCFSCSSLRSALVIDFCDFDAGGATAPSVAGGAPFCADVEAPGSWLSIVIFVTRIETSKEMVVVNRRHGLAL
jgi:hypothetical protein